MRSGERLTRRQQLAVVMVHVGFTVLALADMVALTQVSWVRITAASVAAMLGFLVASHVPVALARGSPTI